jgi:hypothetical protein
MRGTTPGSVTPINSLPLHWIILNTSILIMSFIKFLQVMKVFVDFQSLIALISDVYMAIQNFMTLFVLTELFFMLMARAVGVTFDLEDYPDLWYPFAYFLYWFRCSIGDISVPS